MKLLIAFAMAAAFASLPVRQVAACSCAMMGIEEAAASAHAVFAGTVIEEQPVGIGADPMGALAATVPMPGPMGQAVYTFEVDGVAKGDVAARAEVLAGGDGASCGMVFGVGERWLVFASWDGAIHSTGLCSGNMPLAPDEDPPLPLTAPTANVTAEGSAFEVPPAMIGILAAVALLTGVSWLAFRRDPVR